MPVSAAMVIGKLFGIVQRSSLHLFRCRLQANALDASAINSGDMSVADSEYQKRLVSWPDCQRRSRLTNVSFCLNPLQ